MGKRANRNPDSIAERDQFPKEEWRDYDGIVERIAGFTESARDDSLRWVDGEPYAVPYYRALTYSPVAGGALNAFGTAITPRQDLPGMYSAADHEMIDVLLCLDSGYWGLMAGHIEAALAAGIRIEAIEALRDGREEELTPDETQQVEFIRAVRDYAMTDEVWDGMAGRLGSFRGALEFATHIGLLTMHLQLQCALGVPPMEPEDLEELFRQVRAGERTPVYRGRTTTSGVSGEERGA